MRKRNKTFFSRREREIQNDLFSVSRREGDILSEILFSVLRSETEILEKSIGERDD